MEKHKETTHKQLKVGLKHMKPKPTETYKGMERPIKVSQETRPADLEEQKEEGYEWLDSLTEKSNNLNFSQVVAILKNDPELEPLIEDHRELLQSLCGIYSLTAKQMLSIISAAEKEYYDARLNKKEDVSYEETQKNKEILEELKSNYQDVSKQLEDEKLMRRTLEEKLEEMQSAKQIEDELETLRSSHRKLIEENKELNELFSSQSKHLRHVEKLQQDLLSAKSEMQSAVKGKEKLEEEFDKNTKMIEDLRQEITLLQQEKDNLTRKLASTLRSNSFMHHRTQGVRVNTGTPLKALEDSKLNKHPSTEKIKIQRSQSFNSSLKYNPELAALLMDTKDHNESRTQAVQVDLLGDEELLERRNNFSRPADIPHATFISTNQPTNFTLSMSEAKKLRRQSIPRREEASADFSNIVPQIYSPEESKDIQLKREELMDQTMDNTRLLNGFKKRIVCF